MKPVFLKSADEWREWLDRHHADETEYWIGFYKTGSNKRGITYKEAVDEALSYGWIDAVRKSIDDERWTIRFTPRKRTSIWSAVNIKRIEELKKLGRVKPSGLAAYAARSEKRSRIYSFENAPKELSANDVKALKANKKAWSYFEAEAPWYRRTVAHWLATAKKPETHDRRLLQLIDACAAGHRLAQYSYGSKARKAK